MSSPPESTQAPPIDEVLLSEESRTQESKSSYRVQRRVWLPLILFLLTMGSTFVAGATGWTTLGYVFDTSDYGPIRFRLAVLQHWEEGLTYMACLLAMLFAHEMGHFLATVYYGI